MIRYYNKTSHDMWISLSGVNKVIRAGRYFTDPECEKYCVGKRPLLTKVIVTDPLPPLPQEPSVALESPEPPALVVAEEVIVAVEDEVEDPAPEEHFATPPALAIETHYTMSELAQSRKADLQELAASYGLDDEGTKAVLIDRILRFQQEV